MAERDEELGIDFRPALEAIDQLDARVDQLISKIGDGISSAFVDGSKAGLDALSALDAPIKLNVDDSEIVLAADAIAGLDTEPVVVPVLADAESLVAAEADIEALIAAGQLGVETVVTVDDSALLATENELEELRDKASEPIEAVVTVDDSGLTEASGALDSVSASAGEASTRVADVGSAARGAGTDLAFGALGAKELGGQLTGIGGGAAAAVVGIGGFFGVAIDKAIEADAAVRRLNASFGDLAPSLEALDLTGLNQNLSEFAIKIGADDDALRLFAARSFQAGVGAGHLADEVNRNTQGFLELAGKVSVANPQLGSADEIVNNLTASLARGGRALLPYGFSISAAAIQQEALKENVGKTAAELTVYEKQVAGATLVNQQFGASIDKAYNAGLDSPLVKLRSLKTTLEEAIEAAGTDSIDAFIGAISDATPALVELVKVLGEVGAIALPLVATAVEVLAPILETVLHIIDLIPEPVLQGAAALAAFALAAGALIPILGAVVGALALASPALLPLIAAVAAVGFIVDKFTGSAKEAIPVTNGYTKALDAASGAAKSLISPSTSAADATNILRKSLQDATKAAAVDELKKYEAGLKAIGVTAEEASGIFGNDAEALGAISAVLGPLAVRTGAYKGQLKDLNITTFAQAEALLGEIRAHGGLIESEKKLVDGIQGLNNERVIGIEQSRRAALAGDVEAQSMAAARGEAGYFKLATNDAAEATDGFATAAELAKRQNVDLGASLHDATKGFVDLESEVDKTLGLFDKLAGRPIDVAKALIDVKDKTAAFAKSLEGDKGPAGASASSIKSAQARVTAAEAALTAAQAKQAKAPTDAGALTVAADQQKLEAAQTALGEARNKSTGKTKENTKTLDLNTQAGRDNVKQITDLLTATRAVTDAQIKNGDSLVKVKKDYSDQIDVLRKAAVQGGIAKDQFDGLLSTLLATPDQVISNLKLAGVPEALDALEPYNELISKLDEPVQTEIRQLGAVDAVAAVDLLNKKLDELSVPRKLEIQAEIIAGSFNVLNQQIRAAAEKAGQTPNAPQVRFRALGGIDYPHYALGGIADRNPRIVPAGSNQRIFGEPGTGGEAFIPLAADARRGRAVDITADVAGRFGFDLTPKSLAVGQAQMSAAGFDDSRMVSTLAQGFEALSGQIGALRGTVAAMEAGVTVQMAVPPGQSAEAQGARAGQAFRQVARSR